MIPEHELKRLRNVASRMKERIKVGAAGVTQALVATIREKWNIDEVVKLKFEGPPSLNMKRTHEILEKLTGGTLLSRNKEYIVLYRGNDFLLPDVTKALKEREQLTMLQYQEEDSRRLASHLIVLNSKISKVSVVAGTLAETVAATSRWGKQPTSEDLQKMMRESAISRLASLIKHLQNKYAIANGKLLKAERALAKVQQCLEPEELPTDLETITDEERLVFRKMGLSMKPHLILGRREVFYGTIENMHLHWKFRELVKIIVGGKNFAQVKHIAISLEAESGGVLVSIDKTTKGYTIIIYRGKNYQRPLKLTPRNLLTRRQALDRSIELQRREALKHHISNLQEQMELLKSELEEMKDSKDIDEKTFHERMGDASIPSDDDEQDEGEEAYLQIYDGGDEKGIA